MWALYQANRQGLTPGLRGTLSIELVCPPTYMPVGLGYWWVDSWSSPSHIFFCKGKHGLFVAVTEEEEEEEEEEETKGTKVVAVSSGKVLGVLEKQGHAEATAVNKDSSSTGLGPAFRLAPLGHFPCF